MELTEAVRRAISSSLLGVHTAAPGRIEAYDAALQKAKVLPLIKRRYADGKVESMPVISSVPVIFPRTAAASLTMKVAKGDGVLLIFAERALELWLKDGGEQEPGKPRHHDLSDAIAIAGLYPFTGESPGADNAELLLKAGQAALKLDGGKIALGTPAAELLDIVSQLMNLVATGNVTAVGAPLSTAAAITALQLQLDAIKGSL